MSTSPDALDDLIASLPSSGAKPPRAPNPARDKVFQKADEIGVPRDLVDRLVGRESGWSHTDASGRIKRSPKNAMGLFQVVPDRGTLRTVGGRQYDLRDPDQNTEAGLRYLKEGLDKSGGDHRLASLYYFGGPKALAKAQSSGKIPNISDGGSTATDYVKAVGGKGGKSAPQPDALDELLKSIPADIPQQPTKQTAPTVSPIGLQTGANQSSMTATPPPIPKEALAPPPDTAPEQVPVYPRPYDEKSFTGNVGRIMDSGPEAQEAYKQFLLKNIPHVKGKAVSPEELMKNEPLAKTFVDLHEYLANNPKDGPKAQTKAIAQMGVDFLKDPNTKGMQLPKILHEAILSAHWTPDEMQALPGSLRQQIVQRHAQAQAARRPRPSTTRPVSNTMTAESGGPDESPTPYETSTQQMQRVYHENAAQDFMRIVNEEKKRTVMPGDANLFQRMVNRGIGKEDAQAVVNLSAGPPTPSLLQSSEERAQTQRERDEWERHQLAVKAMADSNALTDQLREKTSQRPALQRILRLLTPTSAVDALSEEPKVRMFTSGASTAAGQMASTSADLLHFVDTLGDNIQGNTQVAKLTDRLRDLGAYLEGAANIEPKTHGEAYSKTAGSFAGQAEKFMTMKSVTKLPFWALMGGEAALRTQTQPLAVQAKETAWGIVQGVGIEYGPGVVATILGKMPGVVGSLARQFPNLIGTGATAGGFGGLAYEETKRKGGTTGEALASGAGAVTAVAALSLVGGGAKELAGEGARAESTPEWLRDRLAKTGGLDRAVVIDHDGRAISLYGDPKSKGIGGEEISPEKADKYAKRGPEQMPVLRVSPEEFEQVKNLIKSKSPKSGETITKTKTGKTEAADASSIRSDQSVAEKAAPESQRVGVEEPSRGDIRSEGQSGQPVESSEVASSRQEAVQSEATVAPVTVDLYNSPTHGHSDEFDAIASDVNSKLVAGESLEEYTAALEKAGQDATQTGDNNRAAVIATMLEEMPDNQSTPSSERTLAAWQAMPKHAGSGKAVAVSPTGLLQPEAPLTSSEQSQIQGHQQQIRQIVGPDYDRWLAAGSPERALAQGIDATEYADIKGRVQDAWRQVQQTTGRGTGSERAGSEKVARRSEGAGSQRSLVEPAAGEVKPRAAGNERVAASTPEQPNTVVPAEPQVVKPWEMTRDQIEEEYLRKKAEDDNLEASILGPELAKKYDRLQRSANSSYDTEKANRASDEIQKIEAALSERDRNRLYGIGEEGPQVDELKDYRQSLSNLDDHDPQSLAESMRWAVSRVGNETDPAKMNHDQRVAYGTLREAARIAYENGWDTQEISREAVKAAAGRFADPEDAAFMLDQFIKKEPPQTPVAAAEPDELDKMLAELPKEEGGDLQDRISRAESEIMRRTIQTAPGTLLQVQNEATKRGWSDEKYASELERVLSKKGNVTHGRQTEEVQSKALPPAKGSESTKAAGAEKSEAADRTGIRQTGEEPERTGRSSERADKPSKKEKASRPKDVAQTSPAFQGWWEGQGPRGRDAIRAYLETGSSGQAIGAWKDAASDVKLDDKQIKAAVNNLIEETDRRLSREAGAVAFGDVYGVVSNLISRARDQLTIDPVPGLKRLGVSAQARQHAAARVATPYVVRDILAKVFPDEYANPEAMALTIDVINKDNILGGYDEFLKLAREASAAQDTDMAQRWQNLADAIGDKQDIERLEADVEAAQQNPQIVANINRWTQVVNPELDRMYNEMKRVDPDTQREGRGRVFGARVNLLPESRAAEMKSFADLSQPMPQGVSSSYRNPNVKKDKFMRLARFTGQYSTDAEAVLTNVIGPRLNEVTKLRLYDALTDSGAAVELDYGETPPEKIQDHKVARLPIKVPQTGEGGVTRMVEKVLYVRSDLVGEIRSVLGTDMSLPSNPVFRFLTTIQLAQLTDMTAHLKNIHTVLASAPATRSAFIDALRRLPVVGTVDATARIINVTRDIIADTPESRAEQASMAKLGLIRPEYPLTGLQKITRGQQVIHHVDTASRIVMNRFFDDLVKAARVTDTEENRASFVQQIGEYNRRLMGPIMRAMRDAGFAPFVVAGRNFNRQARRLLTGNPGVEASTLGESAKMRLVNILAGLVAASVLPALLNLLTTDNLGGRPGTPIGAWDLGREEDEHGHHRVIDLMQIVGIRRGLRGTGANAVIEGLREGQTWDEIIGHAGQDVASTVAHPWMGPALGFGYQTVTGKRLDLRGGPEAPEALNVGGGGMQYLENARTALQNQNPLLASVLSPITDPVESEDSYPVRIGKGLLKGPESAFGVYDLQSPAQKILSEDRRRRGAFSRTVSQAEAMQIKSKLHQDERAGKDISSDLDQAVADGKLTLRQAHDFHSNKGMSALALQLKYAPLNDATVRAFEAMDDKQKDETRMTMALKLQNAKPDFFTEDMRARLEKDGFTIPAKIGSQRKVSESRRETQKARKETKAAKRWLPPESRPTPNPNRRYQVTPR